MRYLLTARLSQLQSDGRPGLGLETQDLGARAWAEREGHTIVDIAADTKSGTVAPMDRKHLRPWVTDPARMAMYDGLLALKTDRLSRGTQEDFTRIENWATEHGKALVIADGPQYPARNDSGYWQWAAEKRTARTEWENDRERSMRAQRELRARGRLVGRPPFGYQVIGVKYDKTLVPSELGRQYIPPIFAKVTAGESLASVALWLTAEGVPTMNKAAKDWCANRVAAIIRNPIYRGTRQDAAGKTILRVEALVDAATWKAANANLDSRPGRGRGKAETAERALLASSLFCPACGAPMYRLLCGSGVNRQPYYRCFGLGAVRRSACKNMVPVAVTDTLVSRFMASLDAPILITRVIPGRNHDDELAAIQFELEDLPRRGLDEDDEDAERARLRSERKRVAGLPDIPDQVVTEDSGESYGGHWLSLAPNMRGEWLRSAGITVCAARTDRQACEPLIDVPTARVALAKGLVAADGVSVIVKYPVDMDSWADDDVA